MLAVRTDAVKKDVITREVKTMAIPDLVFKTADIFHIHIKDPFAYVAFDMTVVVGPMIVPIGAPGNLKPTDLSRFG